MIRREGIGRFLLFGLFCLCGCAEPAVKVGERCEAFWAESSVRISSNKLDPAGQADYQKRKAEAERAAELSFVSGLTAARELEQLIVVETASEEATTATVTMHEKENGNWMEILRCEGYVGYNGIAKEEEGDGKTPSGLYDLSVPFGTGADPGSVLPYTQIDESYWWVGDYESAFFNRLCRDDNPDRDWELDARESEHLVEISGYEYCLFIEYNTEGQKNKGSCIFLHCIGDNPPTLGCVAVPQEDMIRLLQRVRPGCRILIDTTENVSRY